MQSGPLPRLAAIALPLLFFSAIALASCSDDPAPSATGSDAGQEAGALPAEVAAFVADLCSLYAPCCTGGTSAACTTATEALAKGRAFDAARASACLESVRAEATSSTFCLAPPSSVTCAAVFKTKSAKEPGAACKVSRECSSGDDGEGLCVLGKCRRAARGKEGDACIATSIDGALESVFGLEANAGAVCDSSAGLYCSEESKKCLKRADVGGSCSGTDISCVDAAWCPTDTKQCAPRTAVGAACVDEYECPLGSRCVGDGEGGAKCTALEAKGGACERGDECDVRKGLVCDTDTTKCIEDVSLAERACNGSLALER